MSTGKGNMPYNFLRDAPEGSAMRRIYESRDHLVPTIDAWAERGQILRSDHRVLLFASLNHCRTLRRHGVLVDCIPLNIVNKVTLFKALAFQKDSEFTELFRHHILRMQETGTIAAIKQRRLGKHDENYEMAEPIVLGYDNVLFPYACLAFGVVIAVPLAFAEVIIKKLA